MTEDQRKWLDQIIRYVSGLDADRALFEEAMIRLQAEAPDMLTDLQTAITQMTWTKEEEEETTPASYIRIYVDYGPKKIREEKLSALLEELCPIARQSGLDLTARTRAEADVRLDWFGPLGELDTVAALHPGQGEELLTRFVQARDEDRTDDEDRVVADAMAAIENAVSPFIVPLPAEWLDERSILDKRLYNDALSLAASGELGAATDDDQRQRIARGAVGLALQAVLAARVSAASKRTWDAGQAALDAAAILEQQNLPEDETRELCESLIASIDRVIDRARDGEIQQLAQARKRLEKTRAALPFPLRRLAGRAGALPHEGRLPLSLQPVFRRVLVSSIAIGALLSDFVAWHQRTRIEKHVPPTSPAGIFRYLLDAPRPSTIDEVTAGTDRSDRLVRPVFSHLRMLGLITQSPGPPERYEPTPWSRERRTILLQELECPAVLCQSRWQPGDRERIRPAIEQALLQKPGVVLLYAENGSFFAEYDHQGCRSIFAKPGLVREFESLTPVEPGHRSFEKGGDEPVPIGQLRATAFAHLRGLKLGGQTQVVLVADWTDGLEWAAMTIPPEGRHAYLSFAPDVQENPGPAAIAGLLEAAIDLRRSGVPRGPALDVTQGMPGIHGSLPRDEDSAIVLALGFDDRHRGDKNASRLRTLLARLALWGYQPAIISDLPREELCSFWQAAAGVERDDA